MYQLSFLHDPQVKINVYFNLKNAIKKEIKYGWFNLETYDGQVIEPDWKKVWILSKFYR